MVGAREVAATTMTRNAASCLTCHGAGETVTENGPQACPDCFGGGVSLEGTARLEWRLRELERLYSTAERETKADVLWLVHELRRAREALVRIMARCQDSDPSDATARDISYEANEALRLYEPS